jgi:hypothetical protein
MTTAMALTLLALAGEPRELAWAEWKLAHCTIAPEHHECLYWRLHPGYRHPRALLLPSAGYQAR